MVHGPKASASPGSMLETQIQICMAARNPLGLTCALNFGHQGISKQVLTGRNPLIFTLEIITCDKWDLWEQGCNTGL